MDDTFENVPAELKTFNQWVTWGRAGEPLKKPYNPRTGTPAKAGVPDTWATFYEAQEAVMQGEYSGVGFEFNGNGIVGLDFDHCFADGQLTPWVADWVQRFDSYTEFSPSGTGLHILCRGTLPAAVKRPEAEMYDRGRYFTVTGKGPAKPLREAQEAINALYAELSARAKRPTQAPLALPPAPVSLDDAELIERATKSRSGATFASLWAGDITGYPSHSEADMGLCNGLAWWCNRDAARVDRLFRQSGLMREKWDRPQAGSTYGAITVANAVATCSGGYDPQNHVIKISDKITAPVCKAKMPLADLRPNTNERYGWSDIGSGNLFADWYKDCARYVPGRKKWFVYTGKVWEPDTGGLRSMELCKKLADALSIYALNIEDERQRNDYLDFARRWQRRAYRETILKDASSVYPIELERFDASPYLFNCQNGTLDLQTRTFRPHSAADLLSKISGVSYDPKARCERWGQFIGEVMQGDADKATFLQKAMGYSLTGDTSQECFFVLFGPKSRNGKGTTMETFMRIMGDYGRTAKPDTIAQRQTANGSGPSEDIARLAGARFVNISEPDKRLVLSSALVKTLTGNDTITARFLNENSFEYYPQFKLFINSNHLPAATDVTLFSSGRVKVIPFERHFSEAERDQSLKTKLAQPENLSGILNWCLDGLWLMQETGFETPAAVLEATDQYRQDSDKISRFIADEMEAGQGYEVRTSEAFNRFQTWCGTNGFREGSIKSFNADMENSATVERKRPKGGGEKTTLILGYRLRPMQGTFDRAI